MSNIQQPEIGDNQIRIITRYDVVILRKKKKSKRIWWIATAVVLLVALVSSILILYKVQSAKEKIEVKIEEASSMSAGTSISKTTTNFSTKAYNAVSDTTVNGIKLTVITPIGGKPELAVGGDVLNDTTVSLVVQAADIRGDNGKILGAFVSKGQLLSSGKSKAGFCAIIDGNITVGVSDSSPYLEQAIDAGGYFFRQYPLVVGGQVVENKPKGISFRKALAELNGKIVVILSRDRMTFHDFSQSLVDLGVTNAIYLVGSTAYGFAKKEDGSIVTFGEKEDFIHENISYLVWRN